MIQIRIYGQPVSQSRPRVALRGRYPHVYEDAKVKKYKQDVRRQIEEAIPHNHRPLETATVIWLEFYLTRPKTLKKTVKHHVKKPDIDNLSKAILDSMDLLITDDNLVTWLHAGKFYADEDNPPGVIIKLYPVED